MTFFVFLGGIFAGTALMLAIEDIFKTKEQAIEREARKYRLEVAQFKLDFINNMANADKYIVGPVTLQHRSQLHNSMIVTKDCEFAIKIERSRGAHIEGINMHNYQTAVGVDGRSL